MPRKHDDSARPVLAIALEGGLVQAAVVDQPANIDLDVLVIDYDTEGASDDEISWVPQGDGTLSEACVRSVPVTKAEIDIDHIVEKLPVD